MSDRAKLDRKLFDAAVNAYRVVPAVLRSVGVAAIAQNQARSRDTLVDADDRGDLASIEVTLRLVVPLVLIEPALLEEMKASGR